MAFGDADLVNVFFGGVFADDVTIAAASGPIDTRGIYTRTTAPALDAEGYAVQRVQQTLDVSADVVALVAEDTPVTVAGRSYLTRGCEPVEDGRITRLYLTDVR